MLIIDIYCKTALFNLRLISAKSDPTERQSAWRFGFELKALKTCHLKAWSRVTTHRTRSVDGLHF